MMKPVRLGSVCCPWVPRTNRRRKSAIVKSLVLLASLQTLAVACAAKKVDFSEGVRLDPQEGSAVPNPSRHQQQCGGPPFTITHTNAGATIGTLEVFNRGVCKVSVAVAEPTGGAAGAVRPIVRYDVDPQVGDVNAFQITERQKVEIMFTCAASTAAGNCDFSYKLSTGTASTTPAKDSLPVDDTQQVTPAGQTTGNMCITQSGKEATAKVISNKLSEGTVRVDFTAQSNCTCNPFTVYAEPADSKKSQVANAGPNGTADGFVVVPKGQSTQLKVKCGAGSLTTETCKGVIKNVKLSITTK
jgi:hypothetical protein